MKKIIAIVLALIMTFALSITAFAAEEVQVNDAVDAALAATNPEAKKESSDVSTTFIPTWQTVYYVTVEWSDMEFEYTYTLQWHPEDLNYTLVSGEWTNNTATIEVNNRSNVPVDVKMEFAVNTEKFGNNLSVAFTGENVENSKFALASADTTDQKTGATGTLQSKVVTATVSGNGVSDDVVKEATINTAGRGTTREQNTPIVVGTITVTFAAAGAFITP